MNKVLSAEQAVGHIRDGMTVGIGGWGPRRKPMGLIRALLRSDVRDLTIVAYGGADVGMLCAAGKVKKVIFAFVSLDFIPLEPYFRQARQNGSIEVMEVDEGMLLLGLRAAAWRVPYIPTAVGLGTDILKNNPDISLVTSPYDDKDWVAMPALNLDVSLLHVERADSRGVCQVKGPDIYMDDWFARAAKQTFVSCDEVVDTSYFSQSEEARYVFWERAVTTGVVEMPGGAHPTSCAPLYGVDVAHFHDYNKSAANGGFQAYVDAYLSGKTEASYQLAVGGIDKIMASPQTIY